MTGAVVVAGGQSRRLGRDKRRLRLWGASGPTLLEHTLAVVRRVCSPVVVALNDPQEWPSLTGICVADRWADVGPLGGIAEGFATLRTDWSLVVAADLPCLDAEVLDALLRLPRTSQAIIPAWTDAAGTHIEPLHGLYRTDLLASLETYVGNGGRSLRGWLDTFQVTWWNPATSGKEWKASFINLNTIDDLTQFTHQ